MGGNLNTCRQIINVIEMGIDRTEGICNKETKWATIFLVKNIEYNTKRIYQTINL